MDKKKVIIITITLAVVGLFAYLIFFSGSPKEDDASLPSFSAKESSRKHKREKQTDQPNAQSANGVITQADVGTQSDNDTSFQSTSVQRKQQGYFSASPILSANQLNPRTQRSNSSSPTSFQASDFQSARSGINSSGGSSSGGGSPAETLSTYNTRLQNCSTTLQPILNAKSTDANEITTTLIQIPGFSMLPLPTQSTYIQSIATQTKGQTADPYCKIMLQTINPQSINVAALYNDCQSMVRNFYASKGSNSTEYDAISAFDSLGILNGATTPTQKQSTLQKYLGAEYSTVISAMSHLNSTNLGMQSSIICAKVSAGIVHSINASSPYLACIDNVNAAKKSNITDPAKAIPVYSSLTVGDQKKVASFYQSFISGSKTAEDLCTFIINNTKISTKTETVLSDHVLNSTDNVSQSCDAVVNATKEAYSDYTLNPNIDFISQIINDLDPYEFLIPGTSQSDITDIMIKKRITNPLFTSLPSSNQSMIAQRLYATYYSLNSFANPSIDGIYTELFPFVCKCSHVDFDDMAWKNAVVAYMTSKRNGGTPIPTNTVARQAVISSSDFRKSCSAKVKNALNASTFTSSTVTTEAIAASISAIDATYTSLGDIGYIVDSLLCYVPQCVQNTCAQSCLVKLEDACDALTEKYLEITPPSTPDQIFNCPLSASGKASSPNVCYTLTDAQRTGMTQNFYDTIQSFKIDASSVRKTIIQNVWNVHVASQKATNTPISTNQCVEEANKAWYAKLQSLTN